MHLRDRLAFFVISKEDTAFHFNLYFSFWFFYEPFETLKWRLKIQE